MTADPPTVKDVGLSRSWPFVQVREREETRREHAMMTVSMTVATLLLLFSTGTLPAFIAAFTAFIAGNAFEKWLVYPDLFDEVSDE